MRSPNPLGPGCVDPITAVLGSWRTVKSSLGHRSGTGIEAHQEIPKAKEFPQKYLHLAKQPGAT